MEENQTLHRKHTHLEKPVLDRFSRMDVALVGTTCDRIEKVVSKLKDSLSGNYTIVAVDADHHARTQEKVVQNEERILKYPLASGDTLFDDKMSGQYYDLALINGNHYPASSQIVFLDSKKEESLKRRLDQLTNILAFVRVDHDIWPWLITDTEIPVFSLEEIEDLISLLKNHPRLEKPELQAIILAGGQSLRMGEDKSQLKYFEDTQELHLARLCQKLGLPTYISKRSPGHGAIEGFPVILDTFSDLGPYGAILSAFRSQRNVSWLVLACDLPFIDQSTLQQLIANRDTSKTMTCLKSDEKDFGEPLAAIYEPKAYPRMLHALGLGYSCPTKILRNSDRIEIEVAARTVDNINTREEFEQVKKGLA